MVFIGLELSSGGVWSFGFRVSGCFRHRKGRTHQILRLSHRVLSRVVLRVVKFAFRVLTLNVRIFRCKACGGFPDLRAPVHGFLYTEASTFGGLFSKLNGMWVMYETCSSPHWRNAQTIDLKHMKLRCSIRLKSCPFTLYLVACASGGGVNMGTIMMGAIPAMIRMQDI